MRPTSHVCNIMDLKLLSQYRRELMGISAIMILICHAPGNGIVMPKVLSYALAQGQIGVDIFLFLSGMGLYYSLSKIPIGGIKEWYKNRFKKLLIPYLIIQGFLTAYQCVVDDSLGLVYWLYNVSTVGFWFSHQSAWFIALLIPLYLIAPVLFHFLKSRATMKTVLLSVFVYIMALLPLCPVELPEANHYLLYNIQYVMIRVPSFIIGMYLAPFIMQEKKIKVIWFIPMLLCAGFVLLLTRRPINTYVFLLIPIMSLFIMFFSIRQSSLFNKICGFYGGISLESYLWNSLRPVVLPLMGCLCISDHNNILMYSLVIIIGTILSIVVSKLSRRILSILP